eukprot:CAMPEP_0119312274 /NCGR_PEP_ID=MMETSP1333-20130426/25716_1 /TAXON_ID=418940 /ORGANISM="Scyphosphaera apsteinii, Strain RCC1455" /LENGTH=178 /DNA_ID=CAMNT_0007316871 /DNA_START=150 /DNA_END=686 /DNA_ORIENTATION=+
MHMVRLQCFSNLGKEEDSVRPTEFQAPGLRSSLVRLLAANADDFYVDLIWPKYRKMFSFKVPGKSKTPRGEEHNFGPKFLQPVDPEKHGRTYLISHDKPDRSISSYLRACGTSLKPFLNSIPGVKLENEGNRIRVSISDELRRQAERDLEQPFVWPTAPPAPPPSVTRMRRSSRRSHL